MRLLLVRLSRAGLDDFDLAPFDNLYFIIQRAHLIVFINRLQLEYAALPFHLEHDRKPARHIFAERRRVIARAWIVSQHLHAVEIHALIGSGDFAFDHQIMIAGAALFAVRRAELLPTRDAPPRRDEAFARQVAKLR